ncbi:hypothetical protein NliqN6_0458 [Naganishia liquefaciens]|uniref:FAS1 domain-containing protein n=1 Tax=Naganishia liquefaciens TaxID=104408 RepID=A0A8H3YDR8_9TREE|nr:hypothetical protein NliqN6_0458 [Naganishia liquefaciens]
MPRLARALCLCALTLLLFTLTARSQLVIQSPHDVAFNPSNPQQHAHDMTAPSYDQAPASPGPKLTECLTVERKLSLFYEYVREVAPVMKRIMSSTEQTTLLVPVNQAIIALPHKPHQDPADAISVSEAGAKSNAERFVMAHTVTTTIPWPIDVSRPITYPSMLGPHHRITFRREGDDVRVDPGNVKVLAMKEASNGRVVYLDGTVPY